MPKFGNAHWGPLGILNKFAHNDSFFVEKLVCRLIESPFTVKLAKRYVDKLSEAQKDKVTDLFESALSKASPALAAKIAAFAEKIGIDLEPEPEVNVIDVLALPAAPFGTAGETDYFVVNVEHQEDTGVDFIFDFEQGVDKVVFTNAPAEFDWDLTYTAPNPEEPEAPWGATIKWQDGQDEAFEFLNIRGVPESFGAGDIQVLQGDLLLA